MVSALKKFVEKHNCLPVSGKIIDMASTSDFYIALQNIYIEKAEADWAELLEMAWSVESSFEPNGHFPSHSENFHEFSTVSKNVSLLSDSLFE